MMKDLLPPITEAELHRHDFLAHKGHLGSEEMKEYAILDQQKNESALSQAERSEYEALRIQENLGAWQSHKLLSLCQKAGIEPQRRLMQYTKRKSRDLTDFEKFRLYELMNRDDLSGDELKEFYFLSEEYALIPKKVHVWPYVIYAIVLSQICSYLLNALYLPVNQMRIISFIVSASVFLLPSYWWMNKKERVEGIRYPRYLVVFQLALMCVLSTISMIIFTISPNYPNVDVITYFILIYLSIIMGIWLPIRIYRSTHK